jgi:hypothetical protein
LIEINLLVPVKKILKHFQWIYTRLLLSLLGEWVVPPLYNSKFPLPKDDLYKLWLKLAQRFRRETDGERERQTDKQTIGDQNSSLELSAQVS